MSRPRILGARVKHRITGLTGIAIGFTQYMNGCNKVHVQPEALHEGKPLDTVWFDEQEVETLALGAFEPTPNADVPAASVGGPMSNKPPRGQR